MLLFCCSVLTVDKKGRRLSQIEVMKMSLKKVEKTEGSDSEEEKVIWNMSTSFKSFTVDIFIFIFRLIHI